jgi:RNA polymerase sigma-70 factor (ECF subfamily)
MDDSRSTAEEATATRQERFLELLDPVHDNLARFVRAMAHDREEARDLMAETLLVAFERFDALKEERAFMSYLFTIARRTCGHRTRRRQLFGDYNEHRAAMLHATSPAPDEAADISALYAALEKLPAEQREAVVLFELSGLPLDEIREIQGGSLSGVKARLARGRRKLAKLLGVEQKRRPEAGYEGSRSDDAKSDRTQGDESFLHFSTAGRNG